MAKTQTEIVNAAYAKITLSADTPATEDAAKILQYAGAVVSDLAATRIYDATATWATGTVPDSVFLHLVRIVAERAAEEFGRPANTDVVNDASQALATIARRDRAAATPLVRLVLDQLAMWGVTSATIDVQLVVDQIATSLENIALNGGPYFADEDAISAGALPELARYIAAYLMPQPQMGVIMETERRLRAMNESNVSTVARMECF